MLLRLLMNKMIKAIVDDDPSTLKRLLQVDPGLGSAVFARATLFESGILHWIYEGDTLLHLAAAGFRVEIVRLLVESGANPNAAGSRRKATPLHYAADGFIAGPAWNPDKQVKTIEYLLDRGANLHLQDANGATPLHRAVRTRSAAAVRCLLAAGANPNAKNKPGSTPFHLAVQNTGHGGSGTAAAVVGQREIIQAFLSAGVSPGLKCGRGKTVLDSARSAWIKQMLAA